MTVRDREADEARALARLAADELRTGVGGIEQVHAAIAGRVFGAVGPVARPVQRAHDTIAHGVYAAVGGGAALAGLAGDRVLARRAGGDGRALSVTPRGAQVLAVLNGLIGDVLAADGSSLAEPMAVRVQGRPVAAETGALAAAFPAASAHLVVLVPGLFETEHAWRHGGAPTYGAQLARDLGATPVDVRYNTGRHVSENGRALAELLEALTTAWPVPVARLGLVGHSMGGLVIRSAAHHGDLAGHAWLRALTATVSLGTPHAGAPLARGTHLAAHALQGLPETRAFARGLRRHSAGIRDLRDGSLVDEDWAGRDPHALRAAACREVPLAPGVRHAFVAATLTRDARHPGGRLLGDGLVLAASASGTGRAERIAFSDGLNLAGAHHLALLNHPAVYARLRDWLA